MKIKKLTVILTLCAWLMLVGATAQNLINKKELTENDIQNLEVRGRFCQVSIQAVNNGTLNFKGRITGNLDPDSYRIVSVRVGNTLKISVEGEKGLKNGWNQRLEGELIFSVPPGINCLVDNSSGSVEVRGLNGGNIDISASSGSIDVFSVRSTQDVLVRASSGSLKINGVEGNLKTRTSSGSQDIDNIKGNVVADASSGAINMTEIGGSVSAGTTSGSISLDNVKGRLDLKASSGAITGNNIQLTANSNFNTTSGSINLRLNNAMSDLSFDLSATSGGLKAGENQGNKRLVINQGGIKIIGTSNSGSQTYDN